MLTRLVLVCQAPTAATRTASFASDGSLDGPGLEKAQAVRRRFVAEARCWSSPARGARETATALGLCATVEPELRDCDYGRWAGRSLEAVEAEDPAGVAQWLADPSATPHGGESVLAILERVAAWLDADREPDRVLAVTHASIVRAAVVHALGAPPASFWRLDVSPLSLTRLNRARGRWTLAGVNDRLRR